MPEDTDIKQGKILIVDDQELNVALLERILRRAGFVNLHSTTNPLHIQNMVAEMEPDILLLDLHMAELDGIQALTRIRQAAGPDDYLPVLVLTADVTPEAKQAALSAGANDFLTKPFDRTEVVLRIQNLLRTRMLHLQLQQYNDTLEERVKRRTEELHNAKSEILQLLGRAGEYRDDMTGKHTQRVGYMAGRLAEQIGLSDSQVRLIQMAAPLHDIGKIGIPDNLLLKPGRFEPEEFERMKTHTTIGAYILEGSSFEVLTTAWAIAYFHHEKWDGTGYPKGLQGEEIPLEARIVALADFYDALTHERPYKKAWTHEQALAEVLNQRGRHFDPLVVDAFVELCGKEWDSSTAAAEQLNAFV